MARKEVNYSDVKSGIPLLGKGLYTFRVGDAEYFHNINEQMGTENFGIRYKLYTDDVDPSTGKTRAAPVLHNLWLHAEGAAPINKQFLMAALGYGRKDEAQFDSDIVAGGEELAGWVDTDEKTYGNIYNKVIGVSVSANVDQKVDKKDPTRSNQTFNWMPV